MATQLNKSMVSEVAIANLALGWLGSNPINSFDENSISAQLMRDNYPFIRDAVIEERNWTFATDRHTSTVADNPEWGDGFSHPLPLDWISVYRVYRNVSSRAQENWIQADWRLEGGNVIAADDTVYMWGTKRITDTAKFSPMFVQCLAARLAADLCMTITEDKAQQGMLWQLYGAKLKEAASRDGAQGRSDKIQSNSLLDARASYGGGLL